MISQIVLKVSFKRKLHLHFTYILVLLIVSQNIKAQLFTEAPKLPKHKVKQIIEWIRLDFDQKAKEGAVCNFDAKGNLTEYYNKQELPVKRMTCKYDAQNRMTEKTEWYDADQMTTFFAYKKDQVIEETIFRGKTVKTFYYKNTKNQLIEKKTYTKGLELGNEFLLKERILFHYNNKDSLTGEKIFNYDLLGKNKYETRKVIHHYSSKSGKRIKSMEYDFDGTLVIEHFYEYDKSNRLTKTISHYKIENTISSTELLYKNGKIWQAITESPGYKDVKIYVDGRLIRLRSYNEDKIIRIVDYQYVYY